MCLVNADLLLLGIYNEDRIRNVSHGSDAADVRLKLLLLLLQSSNFLLGKYIEGSIVFHLVDLVQTLDSGLDGLEIGQHTAEPSVIYIVHAAALSLSLNGILRLLLGADEQNGAALLCNLEYCLVSLVNLYNRLLKVDDVDSVALGEDVRSHLGIPTTGLVTKVYACFKQLFHGYYAHFKFLRLFG